MAVISSSGWSRGSNASELTQRSRGGGWEVSPMNLENLAKLQSGVQPRKALLGLPSPRDSPSTKLSHPALPQQNQKKNRGQEAPPKNPKGCEPLAELEECCYL